MLNFGSFLTKSDTGPPAPTEYTFNDQFINFSGSGYSSREVQVYVEQACDISYTYGSSDNYAVIMWQTGRVPTAGGSNYVLNTSAGSGSGTASLVAGRTYTFRRGGYTGSSSSNITATLKKGWFSSTRNDYLNYYNGYSWVNLGWPST